MNESVIVILVSVLLLVLVGGVFLFFYFKSIKQEIDSYFELMIQKAGVRLDKIPNLIETVRPFTDDTQLIDKVINMRAETWSTSNKKKRIVAELEISSVLHKLWEKAAGSEELQRNTNFLELKMEFKEIGKEIEEMGEIYNVKVRNYNKLIGFFLLKPFLSLMRFRKMVVFEFER